MSDDPLYRREILRLAADAYGAGHLPAPDAIGTAHNPACGDQVRVELALTADRVTAMAQTTQACVLTQASAALLAGVAPGRTCADLAALADGVRAFLRGGQAPAGFEVFDGVATHPGRHTCVLLPFEATLRALEKPEPGPWSSKVSFVPDSTALPVPKSSGLAAPGSSIAAPAPVRLNTQMMFCASVRRIKASMGPGSNSRLPSRKAGWDWRAAASLRQ